jgi:MOSC domain-containing protein YiiM
MSYCEGKVLSVARDSQRRFSKQVVGSITLVEGHGVEGDAHAGQYTKHRFLPRGLIKLPNRRQIHLLSAELFAELRDSGHLVGPGDLGENVTTLGLKLEQLPLGTRLHLGGTAVIELTGLRTPCGLIDRFQNGLRKKMLRTDTIGPKYRCGVLGVIVAGGRVVAGDLARVDLLEAARSPLPLL